MDSRQRSQRPANGGEVPEPPGRYPFRPRGFRAEPLDGGYLHRLRTFRSLGDLELHSLILLEGTKAAALYLGMVDEYILCTAIRGDKAKALLAIKPFNSSLCHTIFSFFSPRCNFDCIYNQP
jgi:hypothetical protein